MTEGNTAICAMLMINLQSSLDALCRLGRFANCDIGLLYLTPFETLVRVNICTWCNDPPDL